MSQATVSIVAYENIKLSRKCIESVLRSRPMPQIILTNNASTDGTGSYFDSLAAKHGNIRVVHNATNLGFIEPNLRALEMTETPYLVLLNNDSNVVDLEWITKLIRPLEGNSMAALSGPANCASRLRDDLCGYRCAEGEQLEYLEGSCLMCKVEIVRRHGLFSPDLVGAYGEDSDLGLRMRSLGYTLHPVPNLDIRHEGGSTSALIPDQVQAWQTHNHGVMQTRWAQYIRTRVFNPTLVIRRQGAMGDVLLITPIIDAIAKKYPKAPIWVETQAVDLFFHNPKVAGAIRQNFDGQNALLINLDMAYENLPGLHLVAAYKLVAEQILATELDVEFVTSFPTTEDPFGPRFTAGEWVGIHCEPTTWPGKNWPADHWHQVIDWLRGQGMKVCLVGMSRVLKVPSDLDLREETSPLDLAAALGHCSLFIGHDSFPMHVAQSQGVPVIGLFGVTRANLILTNGSAAIGIDGQAPCAGERHRHPGLTYVGCDASCMASIKVEQVLEAVGKIRSVEYTLERMTKVWVGDIP